MKADTDLTLSTVALQECRIPKKFWSLGAEEYFGEDAPYRQVKKYVDNSSQAVSEGIGLFFRGDRTSGKTFLMCLALKTLLSKGYSVLYIDFDELIDSNLSKIGAIEKFSPKLFETDIIGLDNVNDHNSDKLRKSTLLRFLKHRTDDGLPIFIASRLVKEEKVDLFHEQYTDEIFDLITNTTVTVKCSVDPFELKRYFDKIKSNLVDAVEGD